MSGKISENKPFYIGICIECEKDFPVFVKGVRTCDDCLSKKFNKKS